MKIDAFFNQKLHNVVSFQLDSIVQWSLKFIIDVIVVCPTTYQKLRCLNVPFSDAIEDCCLPVFVRVINICSFVNKQVDNFVVAFSGSVKEWTLL